MESGDDRGIEAVNKAITYYQSCLAGDSLQVSVQTFQQLLQNLGGWPLIGMNLSVPWSLNNQEGYLTEALYASRAFFGFGLIPSPRNSSRNLWTVLPSGLTIPAAAAYEIAFIRDFIKQVMMSAFSLVNPLISNETYSAAIDAIVDFETDIANITDFDGDVLNSLLESSNYLTYTELSAMFPQFNWRDNFLYYANMANIPMDPSSVVNVLATDYLISLSSLLEKTDPVILENYSKWHLLLALMPYMSDEFAEIAFRFRGLIRPDIRMPQRYVRCVTYVEQQLPFPIARAFTDEYLPPDVRGNITIITSELEIAMRERINSREWLDETTRQRALSKLNSIHELVAYPDVILNNNFLNSYYSNLNLSMDAPYLLNQVSSTVFNSVNSIRELALANNRSLWYLPIGPPTITNAGYLPLTNQIYIFEGILETPLFNTHWPDYFKYGTVGYVVGHEYTHGFDNNGRRFNEVGNVENWWSSSSEAQFKSRAQCFIDQYDQYSVSAGQVNGTLTLGENIADNGGVIAAYQAYKNSLRKTGASEQTLPGLSYNPDQLFFIASAQVLCQVATPQTESFLLNADEHSPGPIRPRGALSNNEEFVAVFSCPAESEMNRVDKCELW